MCSKKSAVIIFLNIFQFVCFNTAQLNINNEDFFGHTADTYDWLKHPCRRNCSKLNAPQTCHYVFVIETYYAMSKACYDCPFNITDCSRPHCVPADGFGKMIYTVNRQMPGPLIEVCQHDTIVVDVRNRMLSESTSIHWHGIKQRGTPYMDGVPMVTQCPILPGQNFQYKFKATDPGSFFYHSHSGNQRSDGLFGPMVVNKFVKPKRLAKLYDHDDIRIVVNDWSHMSGDEYFFHIFHKESINPSTVLFNGMGRYDNGINETVYTPLATFEVIPGSGHRVRLINAAFDDCPFIVTIDNHTMLVISLDSNDIEPVEVDAITIYSGERIDFVIKANQPVDNYWIKANAVSLCRFGKPVHQVAILRYAGAPLDDPKTPIVYNIPSVDKLRVLNLPGLGTENKAKGNIQIPNLKSLKSNDITLRKHADRQVYISFNFGYNISNYKYQRKGLYDYDSYGMTKQLNHITLKLPPVPLLSQWNMIRSSAICNETHLPVTCTDPTEQCSCTHVINLPLKSVIELVLVGEGLKGNLSDDHALHLHGHFFRVVASQKLDGWVSVDRVKRLDEEGKIHRKLDLAPLKDTIKTPDGGYTIVRFYTDNPGYWFFHCHFETHSNIGMALIFKVGEPKDFPPVPEKFPTCGNYNDDHY